MGFNHFSLKLLLRATLLFICLFVLVKLISIPGYIATSLLLLMIALSLGYELIRFIRKTNLELVRFLDAVRYTDFSQRFEFQNFGAGFAELGKTLSDIIADAKNSRALQQKELNQLKALIEQVPVPLISLLDQGEIILRNQSARRLFGQHKVSKLVDLKNFGDDLYQYLSEIKLESKRLINFKIDDVSQYISVSVSKITTTGKIEYLISLQDIQSELDTAQLQAWQDLVRVLTHEIMNSITPVASLAKTAADLVDDAKAKIKNHPEVIDDLNDVSDAVNTVARRSDSLVQFVGSYRRLNRLPEPNKKLTQLNPLIVRLENLFKNQWADESVALVYNVEPESLEVMVDPNMLEQVLINLIQNSEQALRNNTSLKISPLIEISAYINSRGKAVIDVKDNGPGIDEKIIDKIFVPLFTTKRDGSGVGLSLSRQIILAHGGKIIYRNRETGGAHFSLII